VGLVAGPLIVAFFLAVVRMSRREFGREERATAASDQAGASPG
jgi:hypothetical protein